MCHTFLIVNNEIFFLHISNHFQGGGNTKILFRDHPNLVTVTKNIYLLYRVRFL